MRTMATLVAAMALIVLPGSVTTADAAADDWSFGGIFRVGAVQFRVGFHDADHHRGLYVRAEDTLHGHHRYPLCFADGGHVYHHPTCPLVRQHFRRHDLHLERVLHRHGPTHRVTYGRGHPGHGRGKAKGRRFKGFKHGRGAVGYRVPRGHLPPRGACRIWYPGVPPGHQPPPVDCGYAYLYAPWGSVVVSGGH